MHSSTLKKMRRRGASLVDAGRRICRSFLSARAGVSAVEFALLAPVLLTMWIGTAEVGKAVSISWKSKLVARTLADLTARTTAVTNQGMANIFDAATAVFAPYDATQLSIRISSIKRVSAGQIQVIWSDIRSSPSAPAPPLDPKLPTGILDNVGDTIIYTETFYRYTPMTNWASADPGPSGNNGGGFFTLVGGSVPINYTYYMVPRLTEVARTP